MEAIFRDGLRMYSTASSLHWKSKSWNRDIATAIHKISATHWQGPLRNTATVLMNRGALGRTHFRTRMSRSAGAHKSNLLQLPGFRVQNRCFLLKSRENGSGK
jgi:hypothetical protein